MTASTRDRRLARGRRLWDLTSSLHDTPIAGRILEVALPELDLQPGHTVLDIGCGPGTTFEGLREAVSPGGRVLGVDYSPKMIARAQEKIDANGWDDVEVRRVDFTRPTLEPESVDRALAFTSLSAMPDVPAALRHAHDTLRPGGLLYVFDMKLRPVGWSTPLIWLCDGVYRLTAGYAGVDVLETARTTFAEVRLPEIPNRPGQRQPERGWPPLTIFVARKD